MLLLSRARLSGGDRLLVTAKLRDERGKLLRAFFLRQVAAVWEDEQARIFDRLVQTLAVMQGHCVVLGPPDKQRGLLDRSRLAFDARRAPTANRAQYGAVRGS